MYIGITQLTHATDERVSKRTTFPVGVAPAPLASPAPQAAEMNEFVDGFVAREFDRYPDPRVFDPSTPPPASPAAPVARDRVFLRSPIRFVPYEPRPAYTAPVASGSSHLPSVSSALPYRIKAPCNIATLALRESATLPSISSAFPFPPVAPYTAPVTRPASTLPSVSASFPLAPAAEHNAPAARSASALPSFSTGFPLAPVAEHAMPTARSSTLPSISAKITITPLAGLSSAQPISIPSGSDEERGSSRKGPKPPRRSISSTSASARKPSVSTPIAKASSAATRIKRPKADKKGKAKASSPVPTQLDMYATTPLVEQYTRMYPLISDMEL